MTLKPVLSGKIEFSFIKELPISINLNTGVSILKLGSITKKEMHSTINPGTSYPFLHLYLALPVGLNIPIYKKVDFDLSIINGWHLNDRSSEIIGSPRIYDVALQPGVFINLDKLRLGISYYYGLRDVFGLSKFNEYSDLRFYNHAMHFNIAYKLKTFKAKLSLADKSKFADQFVLT